MYGNKWAFIEQRSALIPRDWEDRLYWVKVIELLFKTKSEVFFIKIRAVIYDI